MKFAKEIHEELRQWAHDDARDTFLEEQLAEWVYNVQGVPQPEDRWFKSHLEGSFQEVFNPNALQAYRDYYVTYLGRALRHLRKVWDDVVDCAELLEDSQPYDELTEQCVDLIEED